MTQKELLYFEDATSHESSIIKILEDIIKNLQDEQLVDYIDSEITIHKGIKDDLMNLLEVKVNE